MSRVLVLGGTGSIGRLVVARLLELDDQPRVLTRDPDRAHRVLPDTAELVAGDLNDTAGVAAALDGVDRLFSLTRNLKVARGQASPGERSWPSRRLRSAVRRRP